MPEVHLCGFKLVVEDDGSFLLFAAAAIQFVSLINNNDTKEMHDSPV